MSNDGGGWGKDLLSRNGPTGKLIGLLNPFYNQSARTLPGGRARRVAPARGTVGKLSPAGVVENFFELRAACERIFSGLENFPA